MGCQPAPAYSASWHRPHRFSKAFTGANGLAANGFFFKRLGGCAGCQPAPAYSASWQPGRPHRFSKAFTGANGLAANGFLRGLEGVRAASPHRLTVQVGSPAARTGFQKLSLGPTGWRSTAF